MNLDHAMEVAVYSQVPEMETNEQFMAMRWTWAWGHKEGARMNRKHSKDALKDLLAQSFVLCTWYFLNVSFHHMTLVEHIDEFVDKLI